MLGELVVKAYDIDFSKSNGAQFSLLDSAFKLTAGAALAVSAAADAFDYAAAPLIAIPIIGHIPDAIITSILFAITRSKRSTLLNLIDFVPIVGDLVPTYTITTLLWIYQKSRKEKQAIAP